MQRRPGARRLLGRPPHRSEAQPNAWRARRAWSRAPARCGALTPPWPRSASASAARVTVTKHSAPPCHNKSPGAPAAGDPCPPLAGRGRHPTRAARVRTRGDARSPATACTAPRATDRGRPSELPPHRISAGARSPPSHPPGVSVGATRPIRAAAPPRASLPGGAEGDPGGLGSGTAVLRGRGRHAWEEREGGNERRRARRGGSSPSCRCRAEGAGRGSGRPQEPASGLGCPAPSDPPTPHTVQLDPPTC